MPLRVCLATLAALALAACEPKASELDGGPELEGAPAPTADAPGDLAGAQPQGQQIILPGIMNIAAPIDATVASNCEKIVAPDYDQPPRMDCVFYLRDDSGPDAAEFDRILDYQLATAGWTLVRSTGPQHYFEYARQGTDCADLSVFTALDAAQLKRLLETSNAAAAPAGKSWRGYTVPATIRETCGADRMRP
jgi:hypothetical protein